MSAKNKLDFKPLPINEKPNTRQSNAQPRRGNTSQQDRQRIKKAYSKPVGRPSIVNSMKESNSKEGLNFDPKIRRQWGYEGGRVVHATRDYEPHGFEISEDMQRRHDESKKAYPYLNLSKGEFVIAQLRRHPIGLYTPIALGMVMTIVLLSVLFIFPFMPGNEGSFGIMALFIIPFIILVDIFSYIAVVVYKNNRFFLTNESAIQRIQKNLFTKRVQTASLGSIEDVSFLQSGILETMLNYGSIRMSTDGNETTYRYHYVNNPRKQTSVLTNAVEDFKNGRPISLRED